MRISDWSSDVCSSDLIGYWFSVAWIFERQAGGFQLCGGLRRHMSCCEAGASAGSLCGSRRDRSAARDDGRGRFPARSEEHTSELQSLMRISYAVFCLKKKRKNK